MALRRGPLLIGKLLRISDHPRLTLYTDDFEHTVYLVKVVHRRQVVVVSGEDYAEPTFTKRTSA
jgi:hypothetical protein